MARTVAISRAGADLMIPGDAAGVTEGFWFESLTRPRKGWRRNRVTADWLDGAPQNSAVLEATEVAMVVHARSATKAGLAALAAELEDALFQWSFTLTVTDDAGPDDVYSCDCADYDPGPYKKGDDDSLVTHFSVTIPIPIPGA